MTPTEAREAYEDSLTGDHDLDLYAPAMETIAELHYEYAVQVRDGWWVGENDAGELVPTASALRALRHYDPDVASQIAAEAGEQIGHECCVTRRLVSDVEVVE